MVKKANYGPGLDFMLHKNYCETMFGSLEPRHNGKSNRPGYKIIFTFKKIVNILFFMKVKVGMPKFKYYISPLSLKSTWLLLLSKLNHPFLQICLLDFPNSNSVYWLFLTLTHWHEWKYTFKSWTSSVMLM